MNKTHSYRFYTQSRQKELQRVRFTKKEKRIYKLSNWILRKPNFNSKTMNFDYSSPSTLSKLNLSKPYSKPMNYRDSQTNCSNQILPPQRPSASPCTPQNNENIKRKHLTRKCTMH